MTERVSAHAERYLDLLATRQKLVASNIANLDTPDYRTRDIDFQFELQSLQAGERPNVIEPDGLPVNNDGNNVSMDREARMLAENAMRFGVAASILKSEFRMVRAAIQEGRG